MYSKIALDLYEDLLGKVTPKKRFEKNANFSPEAALALAAMSALPAAYFGKQWGRREEEPKKYIAGLAGFGAGLAVPPIYNFLNRGSNTTQDDNVGAISDFTSI